MTELLEADRLAIAVTQYDRFFLDVDGDESDDDCDDDDTSLTDEAMQGDVKRRICKQLENRLGVTMPRDLIFLVSGKWALKARNQRPGGSRQLGKYLQSYSRKTTCSIEAPSDDTAQSLLDASGVGVLERRSVNPTSDKENVSCSCSGIFNSIIWSVIALQTMLLSHKC